MPFEVFMKSISSLYKDYLRKELIIFDEDQLSIISKLKGLIPNKYRLWENVIAFFYTKKNNKKGIYLWGKAGSGKTMIMDMCFSISNITEKRVNLPKILELSPVSSDGGQHVLYSNEFLAWCTLASVSDLGCFDLLPFGETYRADFTFGQQFFQA